MYYKKIIFVLVFSLFSLFAKKNLETEKSSFILYKMEKLDVLSLLLLYGSLLLQF